MSQDLSPEQRAELEMLVLEIERRQREMPLGFIDLWHQPDPARTSQRRVAQHLGKYVTVIVGGNRSGKSYVAGCLAACAFLGRSHPAVSDFCKRNGLNPTVFPTGKTRVCCVHLTSADSIRVQRAMMAALLPGLKWRNKDGLGEAFAEDPATGHQLFFKSVDQGKEAFQSDQWDWLWCDEEPEETMWNEARMRLVDRNGRAVISMYPGKGRTWVYDRFLEDPEPGSKWHPLWATDNPHLPQDALRAVLATLGPLERAARERGEFVALEGKVYTDFERRHHVIDPVDIDPDWPRFGAIDFGTRNPFCFLLAAWDPKDDTLHIIGEHYQPERPLSYHAKKIRELTDGHRELDWIVADPEDKSARRTLSFDHGIQTRPAWKDIGTGISTVADRLRLDAEGKPHLVIHRGKAPNLVKELDNYTWAPNGSEKREDPDKPLKLRDHACDALRYLCVALKRDLANVA